MLARLPSLALPSLLVAALLLVGFTLLSPAPVPAAHAAAPWALSCVECPRYFADMGDRSLRLDEAGRPHVAYGGDSLYYSYYDGSAWRYEVADAGPGVGRFASLALGDGGVAYISYYDEVSQDLKLATRTAAGAWSSERVATDGDSGVFSAIARDRDGVLHIVYQEQPAAVLRHARRTPLGVWQSLKVDDLGAAGSFPSLALDPASQQPRVSYFSAAGGSKELRYARFDGSTWQHSTVEDQALYVEFTSLALGSSDKPFIAYHNSQDSTLHLREGDTWADTVVDGVGSGGAHTDAGDSPSLVIDAGGEPHIAYHANTELAYAFRRAGQWTIERIDASDQAGAFNSLALDAQGQAHVSYAFRSQYYGELRYARRAGGVWQSELLDRRADVGHYAAAAADSGGRPHLAYRVLYDGISLRYAAPAGTGWAIQTADRRVDLGQAGAFNSLALGADDMPHISYFGGANGGLRYAALGATGWLSTTLYGDTVTSRDLVSSDLTLDGDGRPWVAYAIPLKGYVGAFEEGAPWVDHRAESFGANEAIAAARGPDGHIAIAYYTASYATGGKLWYARWDGAAWAKQSVATTPARYISLAFDAAGVPHLSFYDGPAGALRYATLRGGVWAVETVDGGGGANVGEHASLAIGPDGAPRIAYYDRGGSDLKYAARGAAGWSTEVVADQADVGQYAALAVGCDGTVAIGYYDASARDMKLASRNEGDGTGTCAGGGGAPSGCTGQWCAYLPDVAR